MDTYEGEPRRLAALRQNATISVISNGFTGFGQTNSIDEIKVEQTASNSEQSALTHAHLGTK